MVDFYESTIFWGWGNRSFRGIKNSEISLNAKILCGNVGSKSFRKVI